MSGYKENNNFIDVICRYTSTGNIIPLRIRIKDTDGEYHNFTIKGYKELSHPGEYISPYGTMVHSNNWNFECKIQVFDSIKLINLFFNSNDNLWKITHIS